MTRAMANPNGNANALIPAPRGNVRNWQHGGYSDRFLSARAAEIADELMELPHVLTIDRASAEEIGRLRAIVERIDRALEDNRVESKRGQPRALLEVRRRYSMQLERWYEQFGLTPQARSGWVGRAALAAELRRALAGDDAAE
jgi:hypothetical protein